MTALLRYFLLSFFVAFFGFVAGEWGHRSRPCSSSASV